MADPATKLFLITPVIADLDGFRTAFEAALAGSRVECVLVRHGARDARAAKAIVRGLVDLAEASATVVLVEDDPRLATYAEAHGVHVRGAGEALADALDRKKPDGFVGCGALRSRHDAMEAGEAGVDYVLFGEPRPDGSLPEAADTVERVAWWAEIFTVPCVGFAATLGDVRPLAAAGADFVALGAAVWDDPRGPAEALAEAAAGVEAVEAGRVRA